MKNVHESNIKIAKFIGYKQGKEIGKDRWINDWFSSKNLRITDGVRKVLPFHYDWSTLMDEVISVIPYRKNNKMGIVTLFGCNRTRIQCYIGDSLVHDIDIMNFEGIECTYEAVLQYIDWFNVN